MEGIDMVKEVLGIVAGMVIEEAIKEVFREE